MSAVETERRTENRGFKGFFKSYGIFFIVSAVIFAAAYLCKMFVFSFENGLPPEDIFIRGGKYGSAYSQSHLDNEGEIAEGMFLGERFDNETVKKLPLSFFILGIDEVAALGAMLNDTRGVNVQTALMCSILSSLAASVYMRIIYEKINKKRGRNPERFYEKAADFVSLFFLESATLYFIIVGMFFVMRFLLNLQGTVRILAAVLYYAVAIVILLPSFLSSLNVALNTLAFPYVVTISNAINEAMADGGIGEPQLGIILAVIAVAMVLAITFVREKLNDLIVKLIMKLINLIGKLFRKKGRRKA